MYHKVENISQERLDSMLVEGYRPQCPDCCVGVGEEHVGMCDVSRCDICGGQSIGCGHTEENHDTWTGYWPGDEYCHKHKLVVRNSVTGDIVFDLNTATVRMMQEKERTT